MNTFVFNFQKAHGLVADGIIGKKTLLAIKNVYSIPTLEALAQFMANVYHETGKLTVFTENLNYSAEGLRKIFPKYFTVEEAKLYAKKPEKIANRAYADRMGNGNEASGDGWKFRGRGALQTTGRENYKRLGEFLKIDLLANPDPVADKYALDSAVFYFTSNKLWAKAVGVDDATTLKIRKAVNGGTNGLAEVEEYVKYFYGLVTAK